MTYDRSKTQLIDAVLGLLRDGRPRTAAQIASELAHLGRAHTTIAQFCSTRVAHDRRVSRERDKGVWIYRLAQSCRSEREEHFRNGDGKMKSDSVI